MANLILGLLMIRSLTIYEIKTTLERKISPFYAASLGAIQTALKKLMDSGCIVFEQKTENGRRKKIYSITPVGKSTFLKWLGSEIPVNKFNNEASLRVFFFGFISAEERASLIRNYVERLKIECDELIAYQANIKLPELSPEIQMIARFQLESLDFAGNEIINEYQWFLSLLEKLEKEVRNGKVILS
jgi:DNA-binding PadR family transcriptional regulator